MQENSLKRLSSDEYFLAMAVLVSLRGTCARRKVGCVLVDEGKRVLATGYNGVAKGVPHCLDRPCSSAKSASGTNLVNCGAVHAEQNALLQCKNVDDIRTIYCTASPCDSCIKLFLNTDAERIVFLEPYQELQPMKLWTQMGRDYEHFYSVSAVRAAFELATAQVGGPAEPTPIEQWILSGGRC